MIRQTDMGSYSMPMVMFMKESGEMIRQTERGHTHMQTVRGTRETGEMTNSTDSVSKHGPMELFMKVSTSKGKRMEKGN
jgi:hypothetical protein